jgi:hypothetical protein
MPFGRGKDLTYGCLLGEEKRRFRGRNFSDILTVILFCLGARVCIDGKTSCIYVCGQACVRACVRACDDFARRGITMS